MKDKYGKIFISILVIAGLLLCTNIYLESQKESVNVNREYKNAIVLYNNKIIDKVNLKITGELSDTHFIPRYLRYSKQMKGTISIDNNKYYLSASTSGKEKLIKGIITDSKDDLISKFEISISEDLEKICIYKDNNNYTITSPSKSISESNRIYKEIVDIPNLKN